MTIIRLTLISTLFCRKLLLETFIPAVETFCQVAVNYILDDVGMGEYVKVKIGSGLINIPDLNLVITVDAYSLKGARPSADTVLNTQLNIFYTKCLLILMICLISLPDYAVQNGFHDILRYIVYWTHHKQGKSEGFDSCEFFFFFRRGTRSRHPRCTRNLQLYASGKMPMRGRIMCVFYHFFMMSSEHEETHTDCTLAQYPQ